MRVAVSVAARTMTASSEQEEITAGIPLIPREVIIEEQTMPGVIASNSEFRVFISVSFCLTDT